MEVKNLKYNPPENFPGHNSNLKDDDLLPYKVFIKYTTNMTGDKEFYLNPDNLNANLLTPATQELAINDKVVLLKKKLPGELIALANNVSGLKLKSYKNEYIPLIKKIKKSEKESGESLSESEQKFKSYVQSNPYFEYNELQCTVENKQSGKQETQTLYSLKSSNGDLFNVTSSLNDKQQMNFKLNKLDKDDSDIDDFKPIYHDDDKVILVNLYDEFKKNVDSIDMPSGKKNVNYLQIYGPPPYDVKYDAIDYDRLDKKTSNRHGNRNTDLIKNWHVTTTTKRVRTYDIRRTEGFKFVKSNVPTYPKFIYWQKEEKIKKKVENFVYRIKNTIDNLLYLPSYDKNNIAYSKLPNTLKKSKTNDKDMFLLKEKKRERTEEEKQQLLYGMDEENYFDCKDKKANAKKLQSKLERKKKVITVNKDDWNSKLYLNRFISLDDEGKSMLPENLRNDRVMAYNYYFQPFTGENKKKMFQQDKDKDKANQLLLLGLKDDFAKSYTFNKAIRKRAGQENQKWNSDALTIHLHFDIAYFEKPPLSLGEFLDEKKEDFFSNIRSYGKEQCADIYIKRCKAQESFILDISNLKIMTSLGQALENLKELFIPKTLQKFMEEREKMSPDDLVRLETQRKEKQKRELEKALESIIVDFDSYKTFVKDKHSKKMIVRGKEEEVLKEFLKAANLMMTHG